MPKAMVASRLVLAAVFGMLALGGCAGPRIVRGVTQRGDEIKFVYVQDTGTSLATGAVNCKVGPDGTLSACQHLTINFKE